mmetsp:Transcript_33659/g.43212  ORF Transcript_33659/g.43212 Transcript_33659/m.43212 type:complete len:122 (-) Transcript_33659:676-1041(-)
MLKHQKLKKFGNRYQIKKIRNKKTKDHKTDFSVDPHPQQHNKAADNEITLVLSPHTATTTYNSTKKTKSKQEKDTNEAVVNKLTFNLQKWLKPLMRFPKIVFGVSTSKKKIRLLDQKVILE